jgi:hypothetical protein
VCYVVCFTSRQKSGSPANEFNVNFGDTSLETPFPNRHPIPVADIVKPNK